MATASNPWLAKSYQTRQPEKKKLAKTSQGSSRLSSHIYEEMASEKEGIMKEKLRRDLLKAWSGGEKAEMEVRAPSVAVSSSMPMPEQIHPMARMRAEMQRTWLARPGQKLQRNEEESSEKIERMESKAAALRKSLLSAWVVTQEQSVEVTEKMGEVSVSEPAGFSSSTVNTGRPSTLAIGCGRPQLAAWTSGQCPIKEEDKEPRIKETKRCLLASWTSGISSSTSSLELVENQDDAASEASIVTLDTITDDSDDFDDFSDMKHELCQWISQ